jgi:hypothetical protein
MVVNENSPCGPRKISDFAGGLMVNFHSLPSDAMLTTGKELPMTVPVTTSNENGRELE